jgi:hypothetical protein
VVYAVVKVVVSVAVFWVFALGIVETVAPLLGWNVVFTPR